MGEEIDILITGATLVTLNHKRQIIKDGSIAVKGVKIVKVGRSADIDDRYTVDRTIDGRGKVVLPGLFDSHVHLSSSLVKGLIYGEPIPLGLTYMPFGEALDEEQVYVAALLSCIDRLKNGVTYIGDVGSKYSHKVAEALRDTGMKGTVSFGMRDKEIPNFPYSRPLPQDQTTEKALRDAEAFHKSWDGSAERRIRVGFSTNIWSTSDRLYAETKKLADGKGTIVSDHLDQHRHEIEYALRTWKERPVEHLDRLGVLGRNFNAHHMVFVADREIHLLTANGVNVCHCPRAALNSHAIPKYPLFNALGINCILGTDMRISDPFELMRLASYVYHGTSGLYYYDPLVLPAETLLENVTVNAAKAHGVQGETGSLERGKRADITLVDFEKPHLTPSFDLAAELTRYAYGSDVETVIIDGEIVMENRKISTVDESEILKKAREIGDEVYEETKDRMSKTVPVNRWKVV
ncbi:MAG: amidohydrolase family protein [Candidatus Bathyarchaeota archaeon]|jgi:5-methylthioadenosine/S-adenosylhomocysteine deaminase